MEARAVHADELHEHYAWLGTLARNLVRDADLAEDLTQETMVAALTHASERTGPLRPWPRGVLHNTLLRLRRSQRRRRRRVVCASERDNGNVYTLCVSRGHERR